MKSTYEFPTVSFCCPTKCELRSFSGRPTAARHMSPERKAEQMSCTADHCGLNLRLAGSLGWPRWKRLDDGGSPLHAHSSNT